MFTTTFFWAALASGFALASVVAMAMKRFPAQPILSALMFFALAIMFYVGQYSIWLVVLQVLVGALTLASGLRMRSQR